MSLRHSLLLLKVKPPSPLDEERCWPFWRLGNNLQQAYSSSKAVMVTCRMRHKRWGLASNSMARRSDVSPKHFYTLRLERAVDGLVFPKLLVGISMLVHRITNDPASALR